MSDSDKSPHVDVPEVKNVLISELKDPLLSEEPSTADGKQLFPSFVEPVIQTTKMLDINPGWMNIPLNLNQEYAKYMCPTAREIAGLMKLAIPNPGGYDEDTSLEAYPKMIEENIVSLKGGLHDFDAKTETGVRTTFKAWKRYKLPRLDKCVQIVGQGDTLQKAHNNVIKHACQTVYELGFVKEFIIEYGSYRKLANRIEELNEPIAKKIIESREHWDGFIEKLEHALKVREQDRLLSECEISLNNLSQPSTSTSMKKKNTVLLSEIDKTLLDEIDLEEQRKMIEAIEANKAAMDVEKTEEGQEWMKDVDVEEQRHLLAQFDTSWIKNENIAGQESLLKVIKHSARCQVKVKEANEKKPPSGNLHF